MKTTVSVLILLMLSICINAQESQGTNAPNKGAGIAWLSATTFDFGSISKGTPVTATFEFINNGSEPLIISEAKGSCGCTSIEYSQKPLNSGEKGFIKATFNSLSIGVFNKSVTVSSNTITKTELLHLKGQVVE